MDTNLADAGHVHAGQRAGDLEAADLAVLGALLADVLEDVLVLLLVPQLLLRHHVQQTQNLRRQPGTRHAALQTKSLHTVFTVHRNLHYEIHSNNLCCSSLRISMTVDEM